MKTKLAPAIFALVLVGGVISLLAISSAQGDRKTASSAYSVSSPATSSAAPRSTFLSPSQRKIVDGLISDRVVRVEERRGKVWIDPLEWRMVDAAGKEQIATLFAAYIWDGSYWTSDIEIYDLQSAKRLATFGKMGFRVD